MSGCCVIKLGGSLLDWADLPHAFHTWLNRQPVMTNIVIVGGGELVEGVRRFDRVHSLGSEHAHWLAVQAMSVTAHLAAKLLPAELIVNLDRLHANGDGHLLVLDVLEFMQADEKCTRPLPLTWDVTSDSIAARVAEQLDAEEFVLLKSNLAMTPGQAVAVDTEMLAAAGIVDSYLPMALGPGIPVRCVNLRSADFAELEIVATAKPAALEAHP